MTQSNDDPQTPWLTFTLGSETYGVDALHVQEVLQCPEISPVPGAPVHVLDIINLRGEVISVNDMRSVLGLPDAEITDQTWIVLMESDGQKQGMLVDSITEIINIRTSEIESTTTGVRRKFDNTKVHIRRKTSCTSFCRPMN